MPADPSQRARPRAPFASPAAAIFCAVGCAAPERPPVVDVALASIAAEDAAAAPDWRSLAAGGCILRARSVARRFDIALTTGGSPFAHVTRAREATLTLGSDGSVGIDVDAGGVTLSGFVSSEETAIFPARPLVLAGGLVPFGWAELRFRGLEPGGVRVGLAPDAMPTAVKELSDEEPTGVFDCDALSLVPETFDPASILSARPGVPATLAGEAALVSTTPDGDARFSIWPDQDAPPVVRVVGRSGARARVTWAHENVLFYGWVDGEMLAPSQAPPRTPARPQIPAETTPSLRAAATRVTCPRPVPVAAEVDGEARFVGHVAAGKVMGLELDETGGFLLGVEGAGFAPLSYSELRLRSDDLRGCRLSRALSRGSDARK